MALFQRLVRHVMFPLSLWRNGELAVLRYLREFERTQYLPIEELRELQLSRLRELLVHAGEQCPFYRERFRQAGFDPSALRDLDGLRRLPPLEKQEIQVHGAELIARDHAEQALIANQTGGSTGTPIAFKLNLDRKCSRAAATLRHNRWAGWEIGDRAAVLWGAPRDRPSGTLRGRLRGLFLREPLWLDTAHVTENSMARFHTALLRYQPRILQAYAGAAVLFARFLEATGRRAYQPQAIVTSAEMLTDADRQLLERIFGCRVFNRYGCREVSVIASECEAHAGLHVMSEGIFLEIETPRGPAAPGEMGTILVTDLLNDAMPLIRYRIGDIGAWATGTCTCGRTLPRLQRIEGRVTDFLVGSDGRLVSGVFLATYVVADRPSLGQVRILQERDGEIEYHVRPGPNFNLASDTAYLERATRLHFGDAMRIAVRCVDTLASEPSGKYLFSRSQVAEQRFRVPS